MATKSRSLSTSKITKVILFTAFLLAVWFTLFYSACFAEVGFSGSEFYFNSVDRPIIEQSHSFLRFEQKLTESLFYKRDVRKIYNYENMPVVYYRAEYPDGEVITNLTTPELQDSFAKQGDDFFRSHKVYSILSTDKYGSWEQVGNNDLSDRRYYYTPRSIDAGEDVEKVYASVTAHTNVLGITTITNELADYSYEEKLGWSDENPCPTVKVAYAFDDESLAGAQTYYTQWRYYLLGQIALLGSLVLAAVLTAIWLLVACGRCPSDHELHLLQLDRIPVELQLALSAVWCCGAVLPFVWVISQMQYMHFYDDSAVFFALISVSALFAGLLLVQLMSMTRKIKARQLLRSSITFCLCRWCLRPFATLWDMLRSCFDERAFATSPLTLRLQKRQAVYFIGLMVLLLLPFFAAVMEGNGAVVVIAIICGLLLAALTYWHIMGNRKTYEEINKGMSDSVAEQMKSERTKTALITNVSHDLKTPLTSIISYVELLSQEELNDTARDYVTILEQKSERMKSMVSDLFDLAKSSSGNITLELEDLDLHRLLEQTLADMRDSIEGSGLVLKTNFPEGEVTIHSDGKKLYRVFQNIIGNALKYSLEGTRVFVSLELEGTRAVAIVRNTAGYEMEFTADEVLQRFSRGDAARSGEGSGLGLSIAESFTIACGGDFRVDIDGDLFKVTAGFPVVAVARADEAKIALA